MGSTQPDKIGAPDPTLIESATVEDRVPLAITLLNAIMVCPRVALARRSVSTPSPCMAVSHLSAVHRTCALPPASHAASPRSVTRGIEAVLEPLPIEFERFRATAGGLDADP